MSQNLHLDRRNLIRGALATTALAGCATTAAAQSRRKPNFVVILADDLGYGDVGAYGASMIRTPSIDRMAREGAQLSSFYASANICTPSRAGLLTGRYPIRTGLAPSVIFPNDQHGLPPSEITIAEALKPDYATALVGKWHLGHVAPHWPPTQHGFDLFFGLPYSHDMTPLNLYTSGPGVELTQEDVDFHRLTERFFDRSLAFIEDNRERPFFLLMALTAPHVPLDPNPDHSMDSPAGDYGDVVEEIDTGVGRLLRHIESLGLDNDTMVIVTSDNGPWFVGSSGELRDRKGGAGWEGGYRVPFVARCPGIIPAGIRSDEIAMNIDLLPTLCTLAGAPIPAVELDGQDVGGLLTTSGQASPHSELILFNNELVSGIRTKRWKYVSRSYYRTIDVPLERVGGWQLIVLSFVSSGIYDVSARYPEVVADMRARLERAQATFEPLGVFEPPA